MRRHIAWGVIGALGGLLLYALLRVFGATAQLFVLLGASLIAGVALSWAIVTIATPREP